MNNIIRLTEKHTMTIPTEAVLVSGEESPYIGTMTVQVNGDSASRFVGMKDIPAEFRVECSEPINDSFAVPLNGLFGTQGKTLMFQFVNGVAERSVTFDKSGEWEVTESLINVHLPRGQWFSFGGLNISVAE